MQDNSEPRTPETKLYKKETRNKIKKIKKNQPWQIMQTNYTKLVEIYALKKISSIQTKKKIIKKIRTERAS